MQFAPPIYGTRSYLMNVLDSHTVPADLKVEVKQDAKTWKRLPNGHLAATRGNSVLQPHFTDLLVNQAR